ncbi:MAG: hypothetical protein J6T36_05120 [Campylobacter sp.]|nr:hypothetical protein [Campylobacter sp.]
MQKLSNDAKQNKRKYIMEYNKKNYKRVPLDISFKMYDDIKAAADTCGESVNGYIKKAIDDRLSKDNML